ncbi:MAG: UDP-glucose/GDP-mannose dehydrogenase family protein [Phycisphaerales bacterium]|jgi:UDPglucose 6-dehydrogenase|nr:UDP-glucose/GDP-mannose dehydrogenase family protein [Phycisphaerales bacterium]
MNITIVGTGYVGLVTGTCFANSGNNVTCLDVDPNKIDTLNKGIAPFYEPGLSELMSRSIEAGRLSFTSNQKDAYEFSNAIFICVGTPTDNHGNCDLSHIYQVAGDISNHIHNCEKQPVVILKSTVPVGTTKQIESSIEGNFSIANNPEFLREGNALDDFMRPDRVVCGVEDDNARRLLEKLYSPFVGQGRPILFFDIESSEMIKYASNAMLACKISFINEIASLCERNGANIENVRTGMCADSRIGTEFFKPGIGYGGSCFPKDTLAVVEMGENTNAPCLLNTAVHEINQRQRDWFSGRIIDHFNGNLEGKTITMWGLSFKPRTDDVRDAPSIDIAKKLLDAGAKVVGYDPEGSSNFAMEVPAITISDDMYSALEKSDALVICTEWQEFQSPDFVKLKGMMNDYVIFDGRNIYSQTQMEELGINYYSVGRPTVNKCDSHSRT